MNRTTRLLSLILLVVFVIFGAFGVASSADSITPPGASSTTFEGVAEPSTAGLTCGALTLASSPASEASPPAEAPPAQPQTAPTEAPAPAPAASESPADSTTPGPGPVAEVAELLHDLGTVEQGQVVSYGFPIRNTGSQVLRIIDVRPG